MDSVGVVSQGVKFIGGEVEPRFTRWCIPVHLPGGHSSLPGLGLLRKLLGVEVVAQLSTEVVEGSSEWFHQGIEGGEGVVDVKV